MLPALLASTLRRQQGRLPSTSAGGTGGLRATDPPVHGRLSSRPTATRAALPASSAGGAWPCSSTDRAAAYEAVIWRFESSRGCEARGYRQRASSVTTAGVPSRLGWVAPRLERSRDRSDRVDRRRRSFRSGQGSQQRPWPCRRAASRASSTSTGSNAASGSSCVASPTLTARSSMCTASSIIRVVRKSPKLSAQPVCGGNTAWSPESPAVSSAAQRARRRRAPATTALPWTRYPARMPACPPAQRRADPHGMRVVLQQRNRRLVGRGPFQRGADAEDLVSVVVGHAAGRRLGQRAGLLPRCGNFRLPQQRYCLTCGAQVGVDGSHEILHDRDSDVTYPGRAWIVARVPSQRPVAHLVRAPLSHGGGSRFDTCRADRCLDPESEGPGCDPGMSGGSTRQAPQGRADHVARTSGCNPVASAVQVRLLPRPPRSHWWRTSLAADTASERPKLGCPVRVWPSRPGVPL